MSENKTEDPTPKRLREAREEGNVGLSTEFTGVVVMVAALGVLVFWMSTISRELIALTVDSIDLATRPDLEPRMLGPFLFEGLRRASWLLFPLLGTTFVIAAFISFVQIGPLVTVDPLIPEGNRLNPIEGFKKLFSKDKLVELGKNIVKISIMSGIGYLVLAAAAPALLRVPRVHLFHGVQVFQSIALDLGMFLVMGLVAFGIFDLWWTRKNRWDQLKMSKKEVEDERKEQEGDPEVEQERKDKHKELIDEAQQANAVEDADAVVANPSHVAVALQYREKEMEAPHVVASGKGPRARKIKRLARRFDVPVLRDVELARSLYDCEVGTAIPAEFYEPVAEILKFIYELDEEEGP